MRRCEYGRRGMGGEGREVADSGAGRDRHWYTEAETSDAKVGKLSCVVTQRQEREREKGREQVYPPVRYWMASGKGWSGLNNNSYTIIIYRA